MNCPYCNEELKPIVGACEDTEYYCQNCDYITGDEKLWQKINTDKIAYQTAMDTLVEMTEELSKTKQALNVAVNILKRIDETRSGVKENLHATNGRTLNAGNGFCWTTIDDIHNAREQITALTKGGNNE